VSAVGHQTETVAAVGHQTETVAARLRWVAALGQPGIHRMSFLIDLRVHQILLHHQMKKVQKLSSGQQGQALIQM
jgi:phage-related protein